MSRSFQVVKEVDYIKWITPENLMEFYMLSKILKIANPVLPDRNRLTGCMTSVLIR
jgi:hypothetical protein